MGQRWLDVGRHWFGHASISGGVGRICCGIARLAPAKFGAGLLWTCGMLCRPLLAVVCAVGSDLEVVESTADSQVVAGQVVTRGHQFGSNAGFLFPPSLVCCCAVHVMHACAVCSCARLCSRVRPATTCFFARLARLPCHRLGLRGQRSAPAQQAYKCVPIAPHSAQSFQTCFALLQSRAPHRAERVQPHFSRCFPMLRRGGVDHPSTRVVAAIKV